MQHLSFTLRVSKQDAKTLYEASQENLSCPECGQKLIAEINYYQCKDKELYSGVVLECSRRQENEGCGFLQY
jgi:tRNA(Ile2) C34 agmatinyltransferase TiaS